MKQILVIIVLASALVAPCGAQNEFIHWSVDSHDAPRRGESFKVGLQAEVAPGWHLYALDQPPGGPTPMQITALPNQAFELAGAIKTPVPKSAFDPTFRIETRFYEGTVDFQVPLRVSESASVGKQEVGLEVYFQLCNDRLCLPPKKLQLVAPVNVRPKLQRRSRNGTGI